MPPKKNKGPSSTQVKKAKDKIVEDKTFGLKNKGKSKKVQQYVQQVKQQTDMKMAKYDKDREAAKIARQQKKEEEAQKEALNTMFKVAVVAPVLEPGVDPKSVLCPYFKAKQCTRGDKCKYSHDQSVGRKGAKLDVYQDRRAQEETNESWDEEKLRSVVGEKHAGQKVQSTIICKFFIEAVREKKYGWFWECPNGETCHYRHALPPGFVLEKKKTGEEEEVEETPLEEILEMERAKLGGQGTPVTLERFQAWKESRQKKRDEAAAKEKALRDRDIAAGRAQNLTGKELLQYRPELFQDDEDPGEGDFDYAALRAQLMAEEDAAAEESVNAYKDKTATFDMDIDESLFEAAAKAEGGEEIDESLFAAEAEAEVNEEGGSNNNGGNNNNEPAPAEPSE